MFIPTVLKTSRKKMGFRKSKQLVYGYQCINPENNVAVIDCRIYTSKRSYDTTAIAVVWLRDEKGGRYSHGIGYADGCGFHIESQAIREAIYEMGIKLDNEIAGYGYDDCKKAFEAIMVELNYPIFVPAEFQN